MVVISTSGNHGGFINEMVVKRPTVDSFYHILGQLIPPLDSGACTGDRIIPPKSVVSFECHINEGAN